MVNLFVAGYPADFGEVEFLELFVLYGMVHRIDLIRDKNTHKSLGYGFIEMLDQGGADRAIEAINGSEIRGCRFVVKLADSHGKDRKMKRLHNDDIASSAKPWGEGFKIRHKRPRRRFDASFEKPSL